MVAKRNSAIVLLIFSSWLLVACGQRTLQRPSGVAQAGDGSLYVTDLGNHRLVHLSAEGQWLGSLGTFGKGTEQIFQSYDLAIDADGNLYICNLVREDEGIRHDGVKVFSPEGKFLREIGPNDYPPGDENSRRPYGLELDNAGRVYLADYRTGTVRVYDTQGNQLGELFTNPDEKVRFKGLNDIAVDDTRHLLYAADQDRSHISQYRLSFDASGAPLVSFLKTFATYGQGEKEVAFPQYLAVNDTSGYLYIGDMANRRIQIFDSEGNFVATFTPPASIDDWQSMGITIGAQGNVLVADALNNTIWMLAPDGTLLSRIEVK